MRRFGRPMAVTGVAVAFLALGPVTMATAGTASPLASNPLAPSSARASTTITLKVHADVGPPGTATLHVTAGERVTVTATGCIAGTGCAEYGYQGAKPCGPGHPTTTPDGSEYLHGVYCGTVPAGGHAPMPTEPVGLLIGENDWDGGNSGWFVIAANRTWTVSHDGNLHLAYNDSIYSDNSGYYTATVTDSTN